MKRPLLYAASMLFVFPLSGVSTGYAQCDNPPRLSVRGTKLQVVGRTVRIEGALPENGKHWYFYVACHSSSRLFDYSLWTFARFADRDGYYLAESWNLQVLDSGDHPERGVIYDRENRFFFWGDVRRHKVSASIRIDAVVGMPNGLGGLVQLQAVRTIGERKPEK